MKNTNPLEKDIEKKVCDYAKSLGCLCYKFTSPAKRSVPDRLFITPSGVVFFIEFKRLGVQLTTAQVVEVGKILTHNVSVFRIDNVEAGKRAIDRHVGKRQIVFSGVDEDPAFL